MSRLVMGCDNQPDLAHASAIFDHFYSVGGNAFDTGYVYGGGRTRRLLGQWMANRGVREDVVVIVKGAHTPHCDPESLTSQLLESLERQQSEYADIYMMHRDNPDDSGRRIRRRARRAPSRRADQGLRRLELDPGALRGGQRLRAGQRKAGVHRAQQPLRPGRGVRRAVGRLRARHRPGVQAVADRSADPAAPMVLAGSRLLRPPRKAG